jgi:hypothetical protein
LIFRCPAARFCVPAGGHAVQFSSSGEGFVSTIFGGDSEGATPLPIPNRAVKPLSADGTWASRPWESRSPPFFYSKAAPEAAFVVQGASVDSAVMSTLAIVLIVAGVIVAIALILGFLGIRARDRRQAGHWEERVRAADAALAEAAATDRGWQRETMEQAARAALTEMRPDWAPRDLLLVLVDDRPGIDEDRAHFVAVSEGGDEARVVLARQGDLWVAERVE